ncbi:hypothetical protein GCM10022381_36370 [Leifsonia kafniensis]|uniref:NodB homology domain-containing protein n=1 Tax=Leifsonia kafniensis TaxID=475957 RepID=A0ABP7L058_9MICO
MKTRRPDKPGTSARWIAVLTGLILALTTVGVVAPAHAAVGPNTAVTLSFDDANADQTAAVSILNAAGLKGTFYIPSGFVGAAGYLTRAQLTSMANSGHEIGGHTVNHADLTTVTAAEASRQVCTDRATLTSWGFAVTSFAYPFASVNAAAEAAVKGCGYNSARGLGDIQTRFGGAGEAFAETIPPANPFVVKAPDQVTTAWTLDDLKKTVTNAETTGGWVQLTFHHICATACDTDGLSVTPTTLTAFATWLAARSATNNTLVKTANQVIGGSVKPVVASPNTAAPGPGVNGVQNPSLETVGANGVPSCFKIEGFGTNTPAYSTVSPGHTGQIAEKLTMTNYASGDSKLLLTMDLGTCAPTVTPGHTYSLRAWYNSTVTTQFNVQKRDVNGVWTYWTDSPYFAASASYTQAAWTTPAIPAGVTAIAFGLNLIQNGQLITDDYALYDSVGAPPVGGGGPTTPLAVTRLAGADRFGTAIQVSKQFAAGVSRVYVANGWNFPDALSAGPAAAHFASPVLLTEAGSLPAAVKAEIQRLQPSTIVVVGGTAVVSDSVLNQLKALGATVRIGGADRYATSQLIAQNAFSSGSATTAYVASGLNFPDALASAPGAARFAGPVVLVPGNAGAIDTGTVTLLKNLGTTTVKIAGGAAAVSTGIENSLKTSFGAAAVKRFAGSDRYGTAIAINHDAFATSDTVYLATGSGYADAIVGGALAGTKAGPLYLTASTCVLGSVGADIARVAATKAVLFGGEAVLTSGVQNMVPCS